MIEFLAATKADILVGFRAPLLTAFIALVVAWLATPIVRKVAIAKGAVDDPGRDERRVHTEPIPRWGGVAIYLGILVALLIVLPIFYKEKPFPLYLVGLFILGTAIAIMGALDDLFQYSAKIQAVFILLCAVGIQFAFHPNGGRVQIQGFSTSAFGGSGWVDFGIWAIPITAIYIFVVTKTMDTIDGVDGLAAGIAAITAATLSVIATHEEQPRVALITAAIAGASIGFLRHNYNPARIFMGTGGAQLLGFTLAAVSIVGALKTAAAVALLVPVFAFGVPIFDAGFVVVRRVMSGQPITQADKRHLHHTLMNRGLNQRQTVTVLYLVAITLCGLLLWVVKSYG